MNELNFQADVAQWRDIRALWSAKGSLFSQWSFPNASGKGIKSAVQGEGGQSPGGFFRALNQILGWAAIEAMPTNMWGVGAKPTPLYQP